eukprot:TRINITY_DN45611_c0_g1_i1.p1 TRINITY_DN45611_c0_g1~~TRINITY_DN45611_c0_g1_i1.p1  ORF type:complete len:550 (-),score=55.81 TRINITY_DN45611_c0_g1_i1:23-1672(-)
MAEQFTGTIISFNPEKGWGYINSPDLLAKYGKDVFLHRDYIDGNQDLRVNDEVRFDVTLNEKGMPQARNITPTNPSHAGNAHQPKINEQRFTGTIVSFNPKSGWGYINSPSLFDKYGKDVFLHRDYIEPGFGAAIGDAVSFSIELRESDGMPQARTIRSQARQQKPLRIPRAQVPPQFMPSRAASPMRPRYSGRVVSFNPAKGWGYINSPALMNQFGKDVFLHSDYISQGTTFNVNDTVSFSIELNEKGMPQAREIRAGAARDFQLGGATPAQARHGQKRPRGGGAANNYNGKIVSFNHDKGWGYINCPELFATYQKDVFLHRDYIPEGSQFGVNDTVSFSIELNEKGMPQARDIRPGAARGFQAGGAIPAQARQAHKRPRLGAAQNHYVGKIVSFNSSKGWGYINCPELFAIYQKDVFLHKDYVAEGDAFDAQDMVSFSVELNEKGMPQARDIRAVGQRPAKTSVEQAHPLDADGTQYTGKVVSFNPAKGWGYINCPALVGRFQKDVFLHRDYLEEGVSVAKEDTVIFTVEVRESDCMPRARAIRRAD